jgi:uncharacterized protein YneF (UPF0154 family)
MDYVSVLILGIVIGIVIGVPIGAIWTYKKTQKNNKAWADIGRTPQ